MSGPSPSPENLFASIGYCVLIRSSNGRFSCLGTTPPWFEKAFGLEGGERSLRERSAFLASFLEEASQVWEFDNASPLHSGPWSEEGADGNVYTLQAIALRVDETDVLLIGPPTLAYDEMLRILQAARRETLRMDQERKRLDQREVLLHCIIHDLANPLAGIRGGLQLLDENGSLDAQGKELVEIALRETDRVQSMIRGVGDAFRSNVDQLLPTARHVEADANEAIRTVAEMIGPRAQTEHVSLHVERSEWPVRVSADVPHLERVLLNLVDNALRHSPEGGNVWVRVQRKNGKTRIVVDDEGPGVPEDAAPHLFKPFYQAGSNTGRTGLGLHFCRIMAARWGGEVGYTPRSPRGARFWLDVPTTTPNE